MSISRKTIQYQSRDIQNFGTVEPHEDVPVLLILNRALPTCLLVVRNKLLKTLGPRTFRLYALAKSEVTLCVFVSVVNDRLLRERTEVGKGSVHFLTGTFEETATPGDEERVAGEDSAWLRGVGSGCEVANGVLGVAGRSETSSEETNGVSIWETFGIGLMEINCERT